MYNFKEYKNIHNNQQGILFATGPSVLEYKNPKEYEASIKVGVKNVFLANNIPQLDYYFCGDWNPRVSEYYPELLSYKPNICKFAYTYIGNLQGLGDINTYNNEILATRYMSPRFAQELGMKEFGLCQRFGHFYPDIDKNLFVRGSSIVFPALQFMLYTGMNPIMLVGCDCTNHYSFNESDKGLRKHNVNKIWKSFWREFERFVNKHYSNTEIIWINPVGITDMFTPKILENSGLTAIN